MRLLSDEDDCAGAGAGVQADELVLLPLAVVAVLLHLLQCPPTDWWMASAPAATMGTLTAS